MMSLSVYWFIAAIAAASGPANEAEFETDLVRIRVRIQSNDFFYEVTNKGSSPVVSFEVPQYAAYNFDAPESWEKEDTTEFYRAWTSEPLKGIYPNQSDTLSLRVSSKRAVLGEGQVRVGFAAGEKAAVEGVWCPVPEEKTYIALVAGTLLVIILLHTVLVSLRQRQNKKNITVSGG